MMALIKIVPPTDFDADMDGFDSDQHGGLDCNDSQGSFTACH